MYIAGSFAGSISGGKLIGPEGVCKVTLPDEVLLGGDTVGKGNDGGSL